MPKYKITIIESLEYIVKANNEAETMDNKDYDPKRKKPIFTIEKIED